MMRNSSKKRWLTWVALLAVWAPSAARAGVPTEEIQATVEKTLAVLKNPQLKSDNRKQERRNQIRSVLLPRFDFSDMAKRSLGSHWRRRTPEEQREFINAFTDLLEHAYIDRIEAYDDQMFIYVRERQDKDYAEVEGKILTKRGEEFSINYRLHFTNQGWKVYDVVIENISLVNNYRDQFNRVIARSSYEDLLQRIKDKNTSFAENRK